MSGNTLKPHISSFQWYLIYSYTVMDGWVIILFGQWDKVDLGPSFRYGKNHGILLEINLTKWNNGINNHNWPLSFLGCLSLSITPHAPQHGPHSFISRAKCVLPLHLTLQLSDKESLMSLMLYATRPQWFAGLCVRWRNELISVWKGMGAILRGMGCNV